MRIVLLPAIGLVAATIVALTYCSITARSVHEETTPPAVGVAAPSGAAVREVSAPDTGRHTAATPPAPQTSGEPDLATTQGGTLVVRVVRDGTTLPVVGAAVRILGDEHRTDTDGTATFSLTAGMQPIDVSPPGQDLLPESGWATVVAGEHAEVSIGLRTRRALTFWARLLWADDGTPLPGVALTAHRCAVAGTIATDGDGRFQLQGDPEGGWAEAHIEGGPPLTIALVRGHETPERELVVCVRRPARLEVAIDGGGRAAGLRLALDYAATAVTVPDGVVRGPLRREVAREVGADNTVRLEGLPSGIELRASLRDSDGGERCATQRWELRPGDNRRRIAMLASGSLTGKLVDQRDQPIAATRIAALRPDADDPPETMPWWRLRGGFVHDATSDSDGEFAFTDLPAGSWLVGVAPPELSLGAVRGMRITPTATVAEVVPGRETAVTLRATAGLSIRGSVVAPRAATDVRLEGIVITASPRRGAAVIGRTDAAGRFTVQPLLPQAYTLSVDAELESELGTRAPVEAMAGDTDVTLHLHPIAGTVEILALAAGRPTRAWITARQRGGDLAVATRARLDGRVRFPGLVAGTWDLTASDRAGRAAHGEVVVVAGVEQTTTLGLEPGATLVLRHSAGDEAVAFEVSRNGRVLYSDPLGAAGAPGVVRLTVAPGWWSVRLFTSSRELATTRLRLAAGEGRVVEP